MTSVEYPGVQLSWRRVLAIAQNLPDPVVAKSILSEDNDEEYEQEQTTFNRMQCMNKALQNIYTITSQDQGYIAFMATMAVELKHQCPISMAFLKHVIDFSEIPTKQTLEQVTIALLSKVSAKQTKINATIIWSMLAQKFAGSLAESIWTDALGDLLIQCLYDDSSIYSLLAIESFALTGSLKRLLQDQFGIARVLQYALDTVDQNICSLQPSPLLPTFESIKSAATTDSPDLTLASIKHHIRIYQELKSAFKSCKSKLSKKRKLFRKSQGRGYKSLCNDIQDQTIVKTHEEKDTMAFLDLRKLHFCLNWSINNTFSTVRKKSPVLSFQHSLIIFIRRLLQKATLYLINKPIFSQSTPTAIANSVWTDSKFETIHSFLNQCEQQLAYQQRKAVNGTMRSFYSLMALCKLDGELKSVYYRLKTEVVLAMMLMDLHLIHTVVESGQLASYTHLLLLQVNVKQVMF
ncbi:hypothetical protein PS15p_211058 [Mucor circinelloides]